MKKLLIVFSVFLVCSIMLTPVNAEILPSDYSEAGEYMVYDYFLESCHETTLWSKLDYDKNGNLKEFFKTADGVTVEYFHREIDPNKELNDDNIETIYYEIPDKYAGLKTLSGEQIILTLNLPLDFGEVELTNGERSDFSYELIDSDLMYPAYTLDGRGVDFKEVYGLYGDVNYIYVLAGEPFPEYTVTLLPDTTYELLTNPLWKNEKEERIKFSGTVNDCITLPECTYEKPGYQFAYWADGAGEYQSGDSYRIPNRDVTLNAMWTEIDDSVVSDSDNDASNELPKNEEDTQLTYTEVTIDSEEANLNESGSDEENKNEEKIDKEVTPINKENNLLIPIAGIGSLVLVLVFIILLRHKK